jgi:hypothetical protein
VFFDLFLLMGAIIDGVAGKTYCGQVKRCLLFRN